MEDSLSQDQLKRLTTAVEKLTDSLTNFQNKHAKDREDQRKYIYEEIRRLELDLTQYRTKYNGSSQASQVMRDSHETLRDCVSNLQKDVAVLKWFDRTIVIPLLLTLIGAAILNLMRR